MAETSTTAPDLSHIAEQLRPLAVPVADLTVDPANARRHPQRNLSAIEASLRVYGQRKPIVVRREGMVVEAGNGTLEAARLLCWTHVAAVVVDDDPVTATGYAISDNRTAELAEWDDEVLGRLLGELRTEDVDLNELGWTDEDLDSLLSDLDVGPDEGAGLGEDPGPEEPPEEPVSKRGEVYALGPHRLMCGDSTDLADVERLMAGEKAHLFATDPPYLVDYTGADRPNNSGKDWSHVYNEVAIKDASGFFHATFGNAAQVLQQNAAWYCWHAHKRAAVIEAVWAEFDVLNHQQIVWLKPTALHGFSFWPYQHEPCLMGWRRGHKPAHDGDNSHRITTVWTADWEGKARPVGNEHPTEKPTRLFEIPILKHTQPGDLCYEPFAGSGSQLIAAAKTGRRCYAMELSARFCDVIRKRWGEYARSAGIDPGEGAL